MHTGGAATVDLLVHEARRALKPESSPKTVQSTGINPISIRWRFALPRLVVVSALLAAMSLTPVSAQLRQMALGVWADEDGQSNIEIAPCGDDLCGRIVWLKEPFDASGRAQTDINNPDTSLRTRPLLGLLIIAGLRPDDDGDRLVGRVYNAEDGKIYDVYMAPRGQTMDVEGCFLAFLCGSQTWTRVR